MADFEAEGFTGPPRVGSHRYKRARENLQAAIPRAEQDLSERKVDLAKAEQHYARMHKRFQNVHIEEMDKGTAVMEFMRRERAAQRDVHSARERLDEAKEAVNDAEMRLHAAERRFERFVLDHEFGDAPGRLADRLVRVEQLLLTFGAALAASLVTALQRGAIADYGLNPTVFMFGVWAAGASLAVGFLYFVPDLVIDALDSRSYRRGASPHESKSYAWSEDIRSIHYAVLAMQVLLLVAALDIQIRTLLIMANGQAGT